MQSVTETVNNAEVSWFVFLPHAPSSACSFLCMLLPPSHCHSLQHTLVHLAMASFDLDALQANIEQNFELYSGGPPQYGSSEFNIDDIDPWLRDLGHSSDLDPPTRGPPPPHTPNRRPREESITPWCRKKHAEATQLLRNSVGESLDLCHGDQQKLEVFSRVSLDANTAVIC